MSVSRLYRLLKLITILQSGQSCSVDELAQELEVSRRTIFRDLNMLELAHIPYYFDRQRETYCINQHFFLAPVNLTLNEALSLLLSARRVSASTIQPLASACQRAALKLESVLPAPVREYLGTVLDKLSVTPAPPARHEGVDQIFDTLLEAIAQRKVCRMVYISFHERKQMTLKIQPLRLAFVGRAWYVIAFSSVHGQRRTFKLGRIKRISATPESFVPPPAEQAGDGFGEAWSMIPEGRLYDVHLRFGSKVAGNVAEVMWHHSQKVQWNSDGSIDFTVRVDGLGEIAWWVLGYGDQVKVVSPPELAQRVKQTAVNVLEQYQAGRN